MESSLASTSTTLVPDQLEMDSLSELNLKSHGNVESVDFELLFKGGDDLKRPPPRQEVTKFQGGDGSRSYGGSDSESQGGSDSEYSFESSYHGNSESEEMETLKIESKSKSKSSKIPAFVEFKSRSGLLDPNGPSDRSDPKHVLLSAISGDFSYVEEFIGIPLAQAIKNDREYVTRMLTATSEPLKRNLLHWAVIYNKKDILHWFYGYTRIEKDFIRARDYHLRARKNHKWSEKDHRRAKKEYRRTGKDYRRAVKIFRKFINAQDVYGYTSLHLAVQRKYEDIVQGLLRFNDIIDACIPAGNMLACEDNTTKSNQLTPLHIAARNGPFSIIKMILESLDYWSSGGAISAQSRSGKTVLHYAAEGGDWRIVRYLLQISKTQRDGKNVVNDCDVLRQTPLYLAASKQNVDALEVLLREGEGLEVNIVTWEGITALDIAKKRRKQHHVPDGQENVNQRIVDMLESFDVNLLQAERSKYANAANSLLVGAALIAGVTYAGWLQPPLGYSSTDSYAEVEEHPEIQLFWFFNSMSFFFSVATFIIGADASIPERRASLREEVVQLRNSVVRASFVLCVAIFFVIGAFASAGILVLPPNQKQRAPMYVTVIFGVGLCVTLLAFFIRKSWRWFRSPSLEFTRSKRQLSPSEGIDSFGRPRTSRKYKVLDAHGKVSKDAYLSE